APVAFLAQPAPACVVALRAGAAPAYFLPHKVASLLAVADTIRHQPLSRAVADLIHCQAPAANRGVGASSEGGAAVVGSVRTAVTGRRALVSPRRLNPQLLQLLPGARRVPLPPRGCSWGGTGLRRRELGQALHEALDGGAREAPFAADTGGLQSDE